MTGPERERAVARTARRQKRLIRHDQLVAHGATPSLIRRWVAAERMTRLYRGVYLLGSRPLDPWAAELAAVFALGDGALASHRSAAMLWGLPVAAPEMVEITVPGRNPASRPRIAVHRATTFSEEDGSHRHGVPATKPALTAIDLAASLPARDAEAAVEFALAEKIVSRTALEDALARHLRRPGTGFIRTLLAAGQEPQHIRSEAERILRDLTRAAELPQPLANERICGYLVDLVWAEQKVAVEFDSVAHHADRVSFHRDRRKHSALAAAGFLLLPITWPRLTRHPYAVVAELASALANGR